MRSDCSLKTIGSAVGAEIILDGESYVNFGGSSYLGLSAHAQILQAGVNTLRECGAGVPIPRDQGVATRAHRTFEAEAVTFFGAPAALYINSGYLFGLIAMATLREQFHVVFYDHLAHYSLREAIAASGLPSWSFKHLDAADLRSQLRRHLRGSVRPLVVIDGMFPALGEIAPLDEICRVVVPYGGRVLVDESHSFGVLGASGRGACEHFRVGSPEVLMGGSLAKAFGTNGGVMLGTADEVARFRMAPAARGASPGLPAAAAMCAQSLSHVRNHPELLVRLRQNVFYLKAGLRELGLNVGDSDAPIAAFSIGTTQSMQALQRDLLDERIFVFYTSYVGAGPSGAIRCGIFADHTQRHMDALLNALRRRL